MDYRLAMRKKGGKKEPECEDRRPDWNAHIRSGLNISQKSESDYEVRKRSQKALSKPQETSSDGDQRKKVQRNGGGGGERGSPYVLSH